MALSLLALDKKYSKIIDEFVRSLGVLSPARVKKYRTKLGKIFRLIGDPEAITKNELMDFISEINTGELADSTKRDYRLITKKFFGWLDNPEFVSWIKVGTVRTRIGPEDILTESELSKIKANCKSLRDKALIETLYETATRPQEFLGLRKTDVAFDDLGAIVFISKGKTGARRVRVFNAVVPLAAWIKNHPVKSRDAFLWVDMSSTTKYRTLGWVGLNRFVRRTAERAGVEKRINPYLYRHTRLTQLSKTFTESQLSAFAGWKQGSEMASSYVHLSGRDVDAALLKAHGLSNIEEKPIGNVPSKCVRCGTWCEAEAEICGKCGMALTLQAAMKRDDEMQEQKKKMDDMVELNKHQDELIHTTGMAAGQMMEKMLEWEKAMPGLLEREAQKLEKKRKKE